MNPIKIPYHLLLPCLLSLLGLLYVWVNRKRLLRQKRIFWISTIVFLMVYGAIVGSAAYQDIYLQVRMNQFDIDQNGLLSKSEMTLEAQKMLRLQTADTGRNFSFVSGLVVAFLIAITFYIIGSIWKGRKTRLIKNT